MKWLALLSAIAAIAAVIFSALMSDCEDNPPVRVGGIVIAGCQSGSR